MTTKTYVISYFIRLGDFDPSWNGLRVIQANNEIELRSAANLFAQKMSEESGVSRDRVTWSVSE
jgi:hypothetical protein